MIIGSYSSFKQVEHCGYAYWLRYIKRIKDSTADFTGTVPGTVVHLLAEKFFKGGGIDWDIFYKDFDLNFYQQIKSVGVCFSKDTFANSTEQAYKLISRWRDNFVQEIKKQKLVRGFMLSEGRFGGYKNPFLLEKDIGITGGWDLVTGKSRESQLLLCDFKASESDVHLDRRQLLFYALGCFKKYGFFIPLVAFILFKTRDTFYYPCSEAELKETEDWVHFCSNKIIKQEFNATPSKRACVHCQFKNSCDSCFFRNEEKKVKIQAEAEIPLGAL